MCSHVCLVIATLEKEQALVFLLGKQLWVCGQEGVLHSVIVVYVASVGVYLLLSFD